MKKITHEYVCDKCGKPATWNLQSGGWCLWEITPKGKFKSYNEWGFGEGDDNDFYCDKCAEKEEII
jgi:hypothetical protein